MANIFKFSGSEKAVPEITTDLFGFRGAGLLKLSQLDLPLAPGFIFTSDAFKGVQSNDNLVGDLRDGIKYIEKNSEKKFQGGDAPLTVKVVPSPSVQLDNLQSIHNIGLNLETVKLLADLSSPEFAYGELKHLLRGVGVNYLGIKSDKFKSIEAACNYNNEEICTAIIGDLMPDFPPDGYEQLSLIIGKVHEMYYIDPLNQDIPCTCFIQMMAYGNFGKESLNGEFYTRDLINGEPAINGFFGENEMFTDKAKGKDIAQVNPKFYEEFKKIARIVEEHFFALNLIRFTVEQGRLWLVSIFSVNKKSTKAEIKTLLDLYERGVIDKEYIIKNIVPNQLNDLLHNKIDPVSAQSIESFKGGIAGSPGACIGRVYFNTKSLLEAYKDSVVREEDTRYILAMPATYAGDVQAIEIGEGVISSEGGYALHAPVVARSLGKPAIVIPELVFEDKSFSINGVTVNEGDYISMEVTNYEAPSIYFGKVKIIPPDMEKNEIFSLMKILKDSIGDFHIRANADNKNEAGIAKSLGATGIGLCRTEHMFFGEERINIFREMLLTDLENKDESLEILNELQGFQTNDFIELFECMAEHPVTIRLLDAPLHEFIPTSLDQRELFEESYRDRGGSLTPVQIKTKFDRLREVNPMLGHRGCRVAVSFFSIYKMQIEAIFEAALICHKNKLIPKPEIMVPMVMDEEELKFLMLGKDIQEDKIEGFKGIVEEFLKKHSLKEVPFEFKIGSMIELPAAALSSNKFSKHVEFISFGTNDLTQTTHGLSRDDINGFLPAYTKFDILKSNPFQVLTEQVKSLIVYSVETSRLVRPEIKIGLCGEHGANEENIKFCIENGLNYVSCSPYGVPLALLSTARYFVNKNL